MKRVKDKGNILIWIVIILLVVLSLLNLTKVKYITYLGLAVSIGIILYWFFHRRKMI